MPGAVPVAPDVILAKLEWARAGGPARQLDDVAGIIAVRQGGLDVEYLARWASVLGVSEAWAALSAR